jgi:hypothetical protein
MVHDLHGPFNQQRAVFARLDRHGFAHDDVSRSAKSHPQAFYVAGGAATAARATPAVFA